MTCATTRTIRIKGGFNKLKAEPVQKPSSRKDAHNMALPFIIYCSSLATGSTMSMAIKPPGNLHITESQPSPKPWAGPLAVDDAEGVSMPSDSLLKRIEADQLRS